ncbi:MAG: DUF1648 domain-containing protein [Halanaeroarchaeum sp.]
MQLSRTSDGLAAVVIATPALVGVALWPALPAEMAIHWSGGSADSVVRKPVAVLGIPAFGLATVVATRLLPDSLTNTPGGEDVTVLLVGVVFAAAETLILLRNLGFAVNVWLIVGPVVALVLLVALADRFVQFI